MDNASSCLGIKVTYDESTDVLELSVAAPVDEDLLGRLQEVLSRAPCAHRCRVEIAVSQQGRGRAVEILNSLAGSLKGLTARRFLLGAVGGPSLEFTLVPGSVFGRARPAGFQRRAS